MITTNDAQDILIRDCTDFGIKTFPTWDVPEGRIKNERIVVVTPSEQSPATYWESCYISVNLCVPNIQGNANRERLKSLNGLQKQNSNHGPMGNMIIRHITTDTKI